MVDGKTTSVFTYAICHLPLRDAFFSILLDRGHGVPGGWRRLAEDLLHIAKRQAVRAVDLLDAGHRVILQDRQAVLGSDVAVIADLLQRREEGLVVDPAAERGRGILNDLAVRRFTE